MIWTAYGPYLDSHLLTLELTTMASEGVPNHVKNPDLTPLADSQGGMAAQQKITGRQATEK